jgi:hypothetical protein
MTLAEFEQLRQAALLGDPIAATREFVLKSVGQEGLHRHVYRAAPKKYPLEQDIKDCLSAFTPAGPDDAITLYHLKQLRRSAFRRYALCLAHTINKALIKAGMNSTWDRIWLAKDYCFPRVFLSMLIGFALVLRAGHLSDWLGDMVQWHGGLSWILAGSGAAVLGLVYLNVRDQLGNLPAKVWTRTLGVFVACVIWWAIILVLIVCLGTRLDTAFSCRKAAAVDAVALVLAILGQFFFTRDGSIGDPL